MGRPSRRRWKPRWADFERCADDCDVVFLGTSHVERHIDPRVVDRTLAEQGMQVRSYNLGLPKMSVLEGAELIERIARLRPRRLKLVVMEPTLYLSRTPLFVARTSFEATSQTLVRARFADIVWKFRDASTRVLASTRTSHYNHMAGSG